jgi:hypothetical protein
MYEFKVDLNRDAVEELTYRLTFDPRDAAGRQRYVLRRVAGESATDPHAAGTVVAQGTTGEKVFTQYDQDLGDRLDAGSPSGNFKNYGEAVRV